MSGRRGPDFVPHVNGMAGDTEHAGDLGLGMPTGLEQGRGEHTTVVAFFRGTGIRGGLHALEVVSFGKSAEADQRAGDAVEREEVFGFAIVATMETAASGQPGHGALDLPAVSPQPLGGFHTLAGQTMDDSAFSEPSAQVVVVVSLVTVELARLAPPAASPGPDGRYCANQRLQRLAVVQVRTRDRHGNRKPGSIGDQVDLGALLAPIDRIRTRQVPLLRARMFTESTAHRDQSSSPRAPSSSKTRRCSFAHTRARLHSVKRRCAVGPEGPNTGGS